MGCHGNHCPLDNQLHHAALDLLRDWTWEGEEPEVGLLERNGLKDRDHQSNADSKAHKQQNSSYQFSVCKMEVREILSA